MLPIAAGCCHYCVVHAKLDFVSVFGLKYIAALCAGVETTVRTLMVNSCNSVGTGSRVNWSTILTRLGQVMGQCDRPGFVAFAHVLLLLWGRHCSTFESVADSVYSVLFT